MRLDLASYAGALNTLTDSFEPTADPARTLDTLATAAVQALPGVDGARITMLDGTGTGTAGSASQASIVAAAVTHLPVSVNRQGRALAILDLYSRTTAALIDQGPVAALLASQFAIMLTSMSTIHRLTTAKQTSQVVGQAVGIMMQRDGLGVDAAFDALVRTSQSNNVKLPDIAQDFIEHAASRWKS